MWLGVLLVVLAAKWLTPLTVGVPPVWEVAISVVATYWLMGFVDHDRPPRSLVHLVRNEVTAPRAGRAARMVTRTDRVRVHSREEAA